MAQTALIDTNILIYAYDRRDTTKQRRALEVIKFLRGTGSGYLSVKTLSEFFVVATRRILDPFSHADAVQEMRLFAAQWPVLNLTAAIAIEAGRGVRDYRLSYWDAQLWATAKAYGISTLFTENMATGAVIDGVAIVNPLAPEFDLAAWLDS